MPNTSVEPPIDPPLPHEALLTLARKAEGAARDGDRQRLEAATTRLRHALLRHLDAEGRMFAQLPSEERQRLLLGQRDVLTLLSDLAAAVQRPDLAPCAGIAQRLLSQLSLQAADERMNVARLPAFGET